MAVSLAVPRGWQAREIGPAVDAIFKTIGDAIGGVLGDPAVGLFTRIAAAYVVFVWLASALWVFVDMRRRSLNPVLPYASAAVIVLASPVLFPFAVLVHRVIRPSATVADRHLADLRDAALAAELDQPHCPYCRALVAADWLLCPSCGRPLGHRCEHCGRAVGLDWDVCAWCGEALAGDGSHGPRPTPSGQSGPAST
jgi:RNA polymerase subunit RPABC4/transcription elongation factor Spt4